MVDRLPQRFTGLIAAVAATAALVVGLSPLAVAMDADTLVKVGVYENTPLALKDENGEWTGVYPDVLDEIASREGWVLEYTEVEFARGLDMVAAGSLDMLLAVADSPERRESMAFNEATFFANWGVISTLDASDISDFTELQGRVVAVNRGDIYNVGSGGLREMMATLHIKPVYVEYATFGEVLDAVASGHADAGLTSRLFAETHAPQLGLRTTSMAIRPSRLAIAFPIDGPLTPTLIEAVDRNLLEMQDDDASAYHQALNEHVYSLAQQEVSPWVSWVISLFAIGATLTAITAWYMRVEVRKRTAELRVVSNQLQAVVDAIPDAFIRVDSDHRLIEARERPNLKLVFDPDHKTGERLESLVPGRLRALYSDLLSQASSTGFARAEYAPFPDTDTWREARAVAAADGEILLLIRDITDEHRVEALEDEQMEMLERSVAERTAELTLANQRLVGLVDELRAATRARDHFVANVSHEFRTPLNAILGFSSILSQGLAGELNEEQARQIDMILGASKRLAALVEDILALERIGAGATQVDVTEFDICKLAHDLTAEMTPLAERKDLSVVHECSEKEMMVQSDSRLLAQILVNLLGNAIKFTDSGRIEVSVSAEDDSSIRIAVSDTGIGIPRGQLDAVFEEFAQVTHGDRVKPEGTGLGLAISRRLAELLGGTLTATSTEGEGSTFTLDMPRVYPDPDAGQR